MKRVVRCRGSEGREVGGNKLDTSMIYFQFGKGGLGHVHFWIGIEIAYEELGIVSVEIGIFSHRT